VNPLLRFGPSVCTAALLLGLTACTPTTLPDANLPMLATLAGEVDGERLMSTLTQVVESHRLDTPLDCEPLRSIKGLILPEHACFLSKNRTGTLVEERLRELGLQVRRQTIDDELYAPSNIIADLPGVSHPEEIVLIAAHYDAFYEGADDNSSGVAALLELARVLSRYRFERTVRFVGFDLEELGLVGSDRFVHAWSGSETLSAAVVLDCLAFFSTRPGSQQTLPGLPSPDSGDFLAMISNDPSSHRAAEVHAINEALKLTKLLTVIAPADGLQPTMSSLLQSDHTMFWSAGRESLFMTDTAFLRNSNYHRPTDTLDTLEHPELFRQAVQLNAAALGYWAGGPL
jgi:hypothetical protein